MINIIELTKSFGKFRALDNINLLLEKGQAISLLGPNGSGKTTLIKSILGLVIPDKGIITINGKEVSNNWAYRSHIGYMPQIGRYPDNMSIGQVINMIKEIRSEEKKYDDDLIKGLGIDKLENKTMRSLSGGTRQKVSACLAFLFSPDIFILDEPTAGLDPVSSEILKEKITAERNKGKLILITSHVLSDLEGITSHLVYLQEGKLAFYKTVEELQDITGELKLNRVVAALMQQTQPKKMSV
ncbi:MAG: ABC transporter ATP-binding protein [Bacteroidetes bacterium]|nr:ABC transporter ATP-binding protein [Bacteroidota bacterium]